MGMDGGRARLTGAPIPLTAPPTCELKEISQIHFAKRLHIFRLRRLGREYVSFCSLVKKEAYGWSRTASPITCRAYKQPIPERAFTATIAGIGFNHEPWVIVNRRAARSEVRHGP